MREVTRVMCDTNYKRERCTWVVQNDNASVRHLASSGDLTPDVPADPQSATLVVVEVVVMLSVDVVVVGEARIKVDVTVTVSNVHVSSKLETT